MSLKLASCWLCSRPVFTGAGRFIVGYFSLWLKICQISTGSFYSAIRRDAENYYYFLNLGRSSRGGRQKLIQEIITLIVNHPSGSRQQSSRAAG